MSYLCLCIGVRTNDDGAVELGARRSPAGEPAAVKATLLLPQEQAGASSFRANTDRPFGRVAAAPELAATTRPLREAKRQPLIEDYDVRPRDCVPTHGRVRACSRSTAQQTATTAVGLELGSHDGLDGTMVSTARDRALAGHPRRPFRVSPPGLARLQRRRSSAPLTPTPDDRALPIGHPGCCLDRRRERASLCLPPGVEGLSWTSPSRRW